MKKIIIVLISILVVILLLISLYFYGLTGFNSNDEVVFTVKEGTSVKEVVNNLYSSKLIKSKVASQIYLYFNKNITVQPGSYTVKRNLGLKEILALLNKGGNFRLTLVEGKRFTDYIDLICGMYNFNKDEVIEKLSNKEYLQKLINKYAFLDESILNSDIYYPLEGYLLPLTYNLEESDQIEDIIEKILDKTADLLDNYSALIEKSEYSYHQILTIASIIESETKFVEDKKIVSEVIYKRLALNMSLGMDVTTYYGVRKSFKETLTNEDILDDNPYNTRNPKFVGLPVGPICNPSKASIEAAINPSNDDYLYFYADIDGKLHFAKTYEEHKLNEEEYKW